MLQYVFQRLLQSIVVIFMLSLVCYYMMSLMPGDPIDMLITSNPNVTSADVEQLRKLYGLDEPVIMQYGKWLGRVLTGDLGYSRTYKIPVEDLLGPRLINTLILSGLAFLVAVTIGILIGIIAGLKPGTKFDYTVNIFAFAGIAMPSFFIAILLILIFAVMIPIFPAGGTHPIDVSAETGIFGMIFNRLEYLILPVTSLTVLQMATYARFARSSMMESMNNDYIRTARAKGVSKRDVIMKHGFRNALIPIVTIIAINASGLLSGTIITETVFAYQGVGKLILDSILANDFNVAMVSFMITVSMVLMMNLLADLLYAWIDPRISYGNA